jgi:hypothetical protein
MKVAEIKFKEDIRPRKKEKENERSRTKKNQMVYKYK